MAPPASDKNICIVVLYMYSVEFYFRITIKRVGTIHHPFVFHLLFSMQPSTTYSVRQAVVLVCVPLNIYKPLTNIYIYIWDILLPFIHHIFIIKFSLPTAVKNSANCMLRENKWNADQNTNVLWYGKALNGVG